VDVGDLTDLDRRLRLLLLAMLIAQGFSSLSVARRLCLYTLSARSKPVTRDGLSKKGMFSEVRC
jgi:hypothetical protein